MSGSLTGIIALSMVLLCASGGPPIAIDNTAKYINGYYSWTLFIKADEDTLQNIDHVEYTLDPSFPEPVRVVKVRGGQCAFAFSATSWGEFKVKVKIVFKNGSTEELTYLLNLLKNGNATGCDEKRQYRRRREEGL